MTVEYDNEDDEHKREELKQLFEPTNVIDISVRRWPDLSEARQLEVRGKYRLHDIWWDAEIARRIIVVSVHQSQCHTLLI